MAAMQTVERVYLHEKKSTSVTKTKRHDYKNGGFHEEVRQVVQIYCLPYSLLSCGHTRQWQPGENFATTKRLSCRHCESISWHTQHLALAKGDANAEPMHRVRLSEAEEAARKNEGLVAEHAETWIDYD